MEGFPQLPGYSFANPSKTRYTVTRQFEFVNGHPMPKKTYAPIGEEPLAADGIQYLRPVDPVRFDPSLTYGRTKPHVPPVFRPHFVLFEKKSLTFRAFFKEVVFDSPDEYIRVRKVIIKYFLEDDTLTVIEPPVLNAGFPQGRLVMRGKIINDTTGAHWNWKDLNVGMDVGIYGIVYHTVSCDSYTREFLTSQGVDVNPEEEMPCDYYEEKRKAQTALPPRCRKATDDKLRRFLQFGSNVLRFYAWWDDRDSEHGEMLPYIIHYFLVDDTIEICEDIKKNPKRSKDEPQKILRRMKIPKNWRKIPENHPSIYLECTEEEITDYYTPSDFIIGGTVFLLGRRFLIYDCDQFTRRYYSNCLNIEQGDPITPKKEEIKLQQKVPPYLGFGSVEDSIQSWYHFMPRQPKTDLIRFLHNMGKRLRYTAELDYIHPEDEGRQFVVEYLLRDGTMLITELKIRNSGFLGGKFLKPTLVQKPGTDINNPEYYTPSDFDIGSIIDVFGHKFKITGVDLEVYRYMEANPEKFKPEIVSKTRKYLIQSGFLKEDVKDIANYRDEVEVLSHPEKEDLQQIEPSTSFKGDYTNEPLPLENLNSKQDIQMDPEKQPFQFSSNPIECS